MKKSNLWKRVEPKEVVKGVWSWENCLEVPEGIIDIMNKDVDDWVPTVTEEAIKRKDATASVALANGPIRFAPEHDFKAPEAKAFLIQCQKNVLDKISDYFDIYEEVSREVNWMENWQYITYRPPKHMTYHSDNHSVRNPRTNQNYPAPYFRRITALTYLNDDFDGGALSFRYFPEVAPYKPPAGSVVIMPSSYMWSHATTPLLNGRKAAFLVSCASHYDVASLAEGGTMDDIKRRELR
ncbi:MAG: 2OG-Fe(II) oxygenase [Rhodospirillaceae bacterium]